MKIILASGSPRRRELLALAGYEFEVKVSDVDENVQEADPAKLVEKLSFRKAKAVAELEISVGGTGACKDCAINEDNRSSGSAGKVDAKMEDVLFIGSDTVVALDGEILGKPADTQNAKEMLLALSGNVHQVYTGVSLIFVRGGVIAKELSFHECTDVYMREMSEDEIETYIATKEPMDKAGAYGIQGKAAVFISKIDGDYYNVVGLPICKLVRYIKMLEE